MIFKKNYKLGNMKNLEDIILNDMIEYPIWVNDLSGEQNDDFDETSERPIMNTNNIITRKLKKYVSTTILIKIINKDIFGSANIDDNGLLSSIVVWSDDSWEDVEKVFTNKDQIYIVAIPSIDGKSEVKYLYNFNKKYAEKVL